MTVFFQSRRTTFWTKGPHIRLKVLVLCFLPSLPRCTLQLLWIEVQINKPTGCILILFLSSTFKSLQVETMLLTCSRYCMHAYRKLMYRSNRSFNIPPGNPRALDFFENYSSNSPLPGPKCRSKSPFRWSNAPHPGDISQAHKR